MSTTAIKTTPRNSGSEVRQFQIGMGLHDGVQYNFFAEGKVFAARVIESRDLHHHSAWLFDGAVREVASGEAPMERGGDEHIDVQAPTFALSADDDGGSMSVLDSAAKPLFRIEFRTPIAFDWGTPRGAVIHQPLIRADIDYGGRSFPGIGYCKRYWFADGTDYLAWRFIEGEVGGGSYMLWTADGSFGGDYRKYDYFKIAYPDGRLEQAGDADSYHRDDAAYASLGDRRYEVRIEGLGTWATELRGSRTQLMLRQRFCKMRVLCDGRAEEGYAINETGVGAIR